MIGLPNGNRPDWLACFPFEPIRAPLRVRKARPWHVGCADRSPELQWPERIPVVFRTPWPMPDAGRPRMVGSRPRCQHDDSEPLPIVQELPQTALVVPEHWQSYTTYRQSPRLRCRAEPGTTPGHDGMFSLPNRRCPACPRTRPNPILLQHTLRSHPPSEVAKSRVARDCPTVWPRRWPLLFRNKFQLFASWCQPSNLPDVPNTWQLPHDSRRQETDGKCE
mmetsp:Transcript_11318/g.26225  ORF Transcript_11318/g.26225 Transcript_11318/m.26225 type:complete len:221 (-) Transcript_11318:822-1484(-)